MPRSVEYYPEARLEIIDTFNWYDEKALGLGLEFLNEVHIAESEIARNPELGQIYESGTKRFLLNRFPLALIYLATEKNLQNIAVAHCKRKPGYWKKRLKTD